MKASEARRLFRILSDRGDTRFENYLKELVGPVIPGSPAELDYERFRQERNHETIIKAADQLRGGGQGYLICRAVSRQLEAMLYAKADWHPPRPNWSVLKYERAESVVTWLLTYLDPLTDLPMEKIAILGAASRFWERGDLADKEALKLAATVMENHGGDAGRPRFYDGTGEKPAPEEDEELPPRPLPPKGTVGRYAETPQPEEGFWREAGLPEALEALALSLFKEGMKTARGWELAADRLRPKGERQAATILRDYPKWEPWKRRWIYRPRERGVYGLAAPAGLAARSSARP